MSSRDSAPTPASAPRSTSDDPPEGRAIGRYLIFPPIASGGMASVHLGRLIGPVGFSRTVAIKRLHPHFERDPEFVAMFVDEARIAARIRHPNVVQTLDVVSTDDELFLVMDYVEGESLARLLRASGRAGHAAPPVPVVLAIICGALQGLHAAHEARGEDGQPLDVVHRDVSPQNILVGVDGTARVLDFGIAKALGRLQTTRSGQLKGKLSYMAPEQIRNAAVTRRTDIYGAAVVLWEALTGSRLFVGDEGAVIGQVLEGKIELPSRVEPSVPPELDPIVMRGLSQDPEQRFETALDMARALSAAGEVASPLEVAEWVGGIVGTAIAERASLVARIESSSSGPKSIDALDRSEPSTRKLELSPPASAATPASAEADTRLTWRRSPARVSRKTGALAGAGAAVLIAVLAGTILYASKRKGSDSEAQAPSASPVGAVTAATASSAPDSSAQPLASTSASSPPVSSETKHVAATRSHPPPRATAAKTGAAPPPKAKCDPPYYIDKDGIKVFKPGCLY